MSEAVEKAKVGKRRSILRAALQLFGTRGFHGTAVPLIAEKAGVGVGTIYRYFEGKEALVNELYQQCKTQIFESVFDGFPFEAPAREQFHVYWSRLAAHARQHPDEILFLEMHHHAPYLDAASRQLEEQLHGIACAYLERARENQATKDLPADVLVALVNGAFVGLLKESMLGTLELSDTLVAAAEECCWQAIRR